MPVKPTLSGRKRANQLGQVNPKTDKTDQLLALKQAHEQEDLALGIPDGVETQVKTVKKTRETAADHPVEKFDPQKSAERIARTYQKRQKQGTPNKLAFSPAQQYQFVMDEMKKLMLDKASFGTTRCIGGKESATMSSVCGSAFSRVRQT